MFSGGFGRELPKASALFICHAQREHAGLKVWHLRGLSNATYRAADYAARCVAEKRFRCARTGQPKMLG